MLPNTIYCGDCLPILQEQVPNGSVDLIYMDPPFGSGNDYEVVFKDGVEVRHFKDRWIGGKQHYLSWLEKRVRECSNALKDTGSFYLHCDDHLNGYIRVLCDDIFGESNFRNEIVWQRTNTHNDPVRFGRVHDTILYYTKSSEYTWNPKYAEKDARYYESHDFESDKRGVYRKRDLSAPAHGRETGIYPWKGVMPPAGRMWAYTKEKMEGLDSAGLIVYTAAGMPRLKRYITEVKGRPLQDIWTDIPILNSAAKDRTGYPTQKPPKLLERIIEASSKPGDLVLDPVCGCGTAIVAANSLGRRWVGIDISPTACRLMARRLGVPLTEVIGLPRSISEVKDMVKIDPIEFQNWVCDLLHAVSTTRRGQKPRADANIDGWILSTIPVQIKGSEGVGYSEVERFITSLHKRGKKEGYIVAFSFSKPAYEEAVRAEREEGVRIDLLEVREETIEANGGNPDVRTHLFSELTKRTWGDPTEVRGPAPPEPLMIPMRPAKRARVRRLTEHSEPQPAGLGGAAGSESDGDGRDSSG